MEQFFSIEDVKQLTGLSTSTIYNRLRDGQLKAVKVGRLTRILAQRIHDASLRDRAEDGKVYPWRVGA